MNSVFALLSIVAFAQAGPGDQPSATHGTAIHEGLPAQVVADLVQQALRAPEDSAAWAVLESAVGTDGAGEDGALGAAFSAALVGLGDGFDIATQWIGTVSDRAADGIQWSVQSAQNQPVLWIAGLAVLAAALLGVRTGRGPRHRTPSRARKVVWKPRKKRVPVFGRRVGLPKAGHLLGQGLPAYEVSRQTGLSRDLLSLVDFRNTGGENLSRPEVGTEQLIVAPRQGGSSAPGRFARAGHGDPQEYAGSTISVTA